MSVNVILRIDLRPSVPAHLAPLRAVLDDFVEQRVACAADLPVEQVEVRGATLVRAYSPWPIATGTDAMEKLPAALEQAVREVDPGCKVVVDARYVDTAFDLLGRATLWGAGAGGPEMKVFFQLYREAPLEDGSDDDEVGKPGPSCEAQMLSTRVLDLCVRTMCVKGEFAGAIDDGGRALQFVFEGPDHYWVEVPDPARGGAHGAFLNEEELRALIASLPSRFDEHTVPGATFLSW